jgi:hypothetical protein
VNVFILSRHVVESLEGSCRYGSGLSRGLYFVGESTKVHRKVVSCMEQQFFFVYGTNY